MTAKLLVFIPKRADISDQRFHEHWRTTHADFARRIGTLRCYQQNHRAEPAVDGFPPTPFTPAPYLGIAEAWFDDAASAAGLGVDPDYVAGARADEPNFMDIANKSSLLVREEVVLERGDPAPVKLLCLLARAPGVDADAFERAWAGEHANRVRRLPALRRYVRCPAAAGRLEGRRASALDGVDALSWADRESFREAWTSPEMAALLDHVGAFAGAGSSAMLADELRVIWPG